MHHIFKLLFLMISLSLVALGKDYSEKGIGKIEKIRGVLTVYRDGKILSVKAGDELENLDFFKLESGTLDFLIDDLVGAESTISVQGPAYFFIQASPLKSVQDIYVYLFKGLMQFNVSTIESGSNFYIYMNNSRVKVLKNSKFSTFMNNYTESLVMVENGFIEVTQGKQLIYAQNNLMVEGLNNRPLRALSYNFNNNIVTAVKEWTSQQEIFWQNQLINKASIFALEFKRKEYNLVQFYNKLQMKQPILDLWKDKYENNDFLDRLSLNKDKSLLYNNILVIYKEIISFPYSYYTLLSLKNDYRLQNKYITSEISYNYFFKDYFSDSRVQNYNDIIVNFLYSLKLFMNNNSGELQQITLDSNLIEFPYNATYY